MGDSQIAPVRPSIDRGQVPETAVKPIENVTTEPAQEQSQPNPAPKWAYFIFFLLGIGTVMGMFMYIVSIDFYRKVFSDFAYLSYVFNLVFNVGGWFASTFFALPLQAYIRPHKIMAGFFIFNFLVLVTAIVLNYTCTLPSVTEAGSSPHWTVMSLLIICVSCHGLTYGVNSSCLYSVAGPISQSYTSAVLAGTASAGLIVALLRIIAKGVATAVGSTLYVDMVATNIFFSIAAVVQLTCIILSALLIKMKFTEKAIPRNKKEVVVEIELANIEMKEGTDPDVVPIPPVPVPKDTLVINIKEWFRTLRASALPGFGVLLTFLITYALYPGVLTDYSSTMNSSFNETGWFVVSILASYSLGDFLGRALSVVRKIHVIPYKWMWTVVVARLLFFALFLLFLRWNAVIYDPFKFVAGFALSFTGGLFACISMMQGSEVVRGSRYAGSVMTFWLNGGISLGAILGVVLKFATASMPRS